MFIKILGTIYFLCDTPNIIDIEGQLLGSCLDTFRIQNFLRHLLRTVTP